MNAFLLSLWTILEPLVTLFVTIVGPVLAAWLAARIIAWMKIDNDARKAEIERQLRDALHQSAANALKAALTKFKADTVNTVVLNAAVDYVSANNPDAVKRFGLTPGRLMDIIESKVPDVTATKGGG